MNEETIEGNNKLIGEFMGAKQVKRYNGISNSTWQVWKFPNTSFHDTIESFIDDTPYHTSFDWIMPVGSKITSMAFPSDSKAIVLMGDIFKAVKMFDIKKLWLAVVEFINWYNKNK